MSDLGMELPAGVEVTAFAGGHVEQLSSAPSRFVLDRITLVPGAQLEADQVPVPAALIIDAGSLTLIDDLGLEATYSAGQIVPIIGGPAHTLRNDTAEPVSILLLTLRGDSDAPDSEVETASPDASAPQRVALIEGVVEDIPETPATLFLARTVWNPGADFGNHTASGPIGLFVESGSLSITRSTGVVSNISANKGVLFPSSVERREQNTDAEPATVLVAGLIESAAGLVSPVAPTPTPLPSATATAIPTETPTPGPTSTPLPTSTPAPSPTATPSPTPEPAVYEADSSGGLDEWNGPQDWKHLNGMLVNDGSNNSAGVWISAPFKPRSSNYAIEAEIQVVSGFCGNGRGDSYTNFGIVTRASDVDTGYWGGVDCSGVGAVSLGSLFCCDRLAEQNFAVDLEWHTYRMEVDGNVVRFYVDGALLIEVSDNRYLESGYVGLWSYGVQVNVRNFRVIDLDA
jgi:hypothetical protein